MTANSNHQARVLCRFLFDGGVYTRISIDNGKVRLASAQETDAMSEPTNWQAIDIDGELTADEILLAHATLNMFVLTRIKEKSDNTPVIAFLHRDNSRIVVCSGRVICETAEEVQGIIQWRKAPNAQVAFDILTTYVMGWENAI